ncbi:MAG: hypothetical protein PWQ84_7 [Thermotogaceae bacterium]|jgi:hypothetical protein|nr:hypothetical protein [Thermotogaceae bacterium]
MINTYNEKSLHGEIKEFLLQPNDLLEEPYKGFIIDIKRDDLLIEIQTKSLNALRKKLTKLLDINRIRIVHPIFVNKEIILLSSENTILQKRLSPKHGDLTDIFEELIYIQDLFRHMNLEIQLLLVTIQEFRKDDGKGSWRRRGVSIIDSKLKEIHGNYLIKDAIQLFKFLPNELFNSKFTTRELSSAMAISINRAQKICYCLKKLDLIKPVSKQGRLTVYQKNKELNHVYSYRKWP